MDQPTDPLKGRLAPQRPLGPAEAPNGGASRQEREPLRAMLDCTTVGIAETDATGRFLYVNEAFCRLTGYADEELRRRTFDDITDPDDRLAETATFADGAPSVIDRETRYVRQDGSRVWVHLTLSVLRDPGGRPLRALAIVRDLTRRKRAEEALRRAHDLIDGITRGTDDMIAAEDPEFRYLFSNDAYRQEFERLWGRVPAEGESMVDLLAPFPDDLRRARELWGRALAGESFRVTMAFGPADAEQVYDLRFNPLRDEQGRLVGAAHILRNVTEQVRIERSLRDSQARLAEAAAAAQQASERLRVNEERYRLVNLATHDVIWDWDLTSDDLFWNDAMESTFGYRLADVPPTIAWWHENIHPDDRERIAASIHDAIDDPAVQLWTGEYRFRHGAGHWVDVLDRGLVARDADGRGVRMIGSMLDLTERKRAEDELRRSEARFRYLADAMPQLVWTTRPDGYHEYFNRQWHAYTGTGQDDGRGDVWARVLHPDDHERTRRRWLHSLQTGEPYEIEHRFRRASDGAYRWFLSRAVPVRDESGEILRWFGTCTDIDEQKRTEAELGRAKKRLTLDITERVRGAEALRRSEAQARDRYAELEQIYRYAPVGLFTLDRNYRFTRINERMAEIDGLPVEAHVGRGIDEITPELAPCLREVYRPVLERGEPVLEVEIHGATPRAPGVGRDWIGSYFPLKSGDGEVVGLIGAVLEVTERKRAEQALKEADRHKDEFLATLAHELRNPLAPISNGVHLLHRLKRREQDVHPVLPMMERQVTHMARLLDDLLDVSRISRGKITLRREPVELAQAVQTAVEAVRPLIDEMGHVLTVSLPREPVVLDADPVRLSQVFANLLNNAAKFTDRHGRLHVHAQVHDREVRVSVRDTGIGIPPESLQSIFGLFTQLGSPLSRPHGGLGIGLSLVKGLVALHGGRVEAKSDGPGAGSEFVVHLPLPASTDAAQPHDGEPSASSGLRILVVDDNRDAASSLAMLLEMAGNEVSTAYGGEEALALAAESRPQVVLLDIGMPKVDGYEVCRRLRTQPGGADMGIVAVTGWGQEDDRRRSESAGFDGHLVKPADPDVLMSLLERLAQRGAGGGADV